MMKNIRRWVGGVEVTLLLVVAITVVSFQSVNAISNSISQGYKTTDKSIAAGMAVSLSGEDQAEGLVERTNNKNVQKFVGIVTTIDESLLSITSGSTDVLVTTTGEVTVFVSDINGQVAKGDFVTISPLNGALMKPGGQPGDTYNLGVALEAFNPAQAKPQTITDGQNAERIVQVDKIKIEINENVVATSPAEEATSFLLIAGESITGRPVGQVQVFAAILLLLIILIVEGSIIYGAVHSTITALGRNPLAKKMVFKQILQVSWLALIVLVFGLGAIYIVLWI